MSWWRRLWPTSSSPSNDSLDELRAQLAAKLENTKRLLLEEMARLQRLESEIAREESSAARWEERAMLGVKLQEDELAREALYHYQKHQRRAQSLQQEAKLQKLHLKRIQQFHDRFLQDAGPLLERAELLRVRKTEQAARAMVTRSLQEEPWEAEMQQARKALERLETNWQDGLDEEIPATVKEEHNDWRASAEEEFEEKLALLEKQLPQKQHREEKILLPEEE